MTSISGPVPPAVWEQTVREARDAGHRFFDWLGCVDEIGRRAVFRIVLVVRDLDEPGAPPLVVSTEVPRGFARLDSVAGVFAGADWHEREVAELFGVEFVGLEQRPLLLEPGFSGAPMRKDAVLGARAAAAWPGGEEPGSQDPASVAGARSPGRRRTAPPGVPEPAVWGDRDPRSADPVPAQIVESTVPGRARRRR